jgi:hypothetical protein
MDRDVPLADLEINRGLHEDVTALGVDDAGYLHVLEFFRVLVVHGFQIVAVRFLSCSVSQRSGVKMREYLPPAF